MKNTFSAKTYAAWTFASGHWHGVGSYVLQRGNHLLLEAATGALLLEDGSYLLLEDSVFSSIVAGEALDYSILDNRPFFAIPDNRLFYDGANP